MFSKLTAVMDVSDAQRLLAIRVVTSVNTARQVHCVDAACG